MSDVREYRLITVDQDTHEEDVIIFDSVEDAYLYAEPGDTLQTWHLTSSHVVLEGEVPLG